MLGNTPNQTTKFRKKNSVEISDDARGSYNKDSQVRFKTSMLKSSSCDYSNAYILVSGTIRIKRAGADDNAKRLDEKTKGVVFKNCAPFTVCISKINNTQIANAKDLDIV